MPIKMMMKMLSMNWERHLLDVNKYVSNEEEISTNDNKKYSDVDFDEVPTDADVDELRMASSRCW